MKSLHVLSCVECMDKADDFILRAEDAERQSDVDFCLQCAAIHAQLATAAAIREQRTAEEMAEVGRLLRLAIEGASGRGGQ